MVDKPRWLKMDEDSAQEMANKEPLWLVRVILEDYSHERVYYRSGIAPRRFEVEAQYGPTREFHSRRVWPRYPTSTDIKPSRWGLAFCSRHCPYHSDLNDRHNCSKYDLPLRTTTDIGGERILRLRVCVNSNPESDSEIQAKVLAQVSRRRIQ